MTLAKAKAKKEDEPSAKLAEGQADPFPTHRLHINCDRCYMPFMIINVTCDGKKDSLPIDQFRDQYQAHLRTKLCRISYQSNALITGATGFEPDTS